jgi:cytochrome c-type biogenesis protein CcmE
MATARSANQRAVRIVISAAVIIGAFSMLFFTMAQKDAQLYKHVDEVMGSPAQYYGKNLQLHGNVDGAVKKRPDTLDYQFTIKHGSSTVLATYSGIVPDTFKTGSEVVLTGKLEPDGFHATDITAKCPSKYQPADGSRANSGGE